MANNNLLVVKTRKIEHLERQANLEWGNPAFREADARFLRRLGRTRYVRVADEWDHLSVLIYIPKSRRLPEVMMPAYALARLLGFASALVLPPRLDFESEAEIFAAANQGENFDLELYERLMAEHRAQKAALEKAIKSVSLEEAEALRDWLYENFHVRWFIRY